MGDIKKKRKLFNRPKKLFDSTRIKEENVLVKKYGLKNKREIWKAKSSISRFRRRAKQLISSEPEVQQVFFDKLGKMGIKVVTISDVLALTEENLLERRLETFVFKKGLANTPKQARQLIVHKNVLVDGSVVNVPSFIVTLDLENKILLKEKKIKTPKTGEISEDVNESDVEEINEDVVSDEGDKK